MADYQAGSRLLPAPPLMKTEEPTRWTGPTILKLVHSKEPKPKKSQITLIIKMHHQITAKLHVLFTQGTISVAGLSLKGPNRQVRHHWAQMTEYHGVILPHWSRGSTVAWPMRCLTVPGKGPSAVQTPFKT